MSKILVLVSTMVLARLLAPEIFGLVAIGLVIISYLDVVSDLGAGPAIIYRKMDSKAQLDAECNTALVIAVGMGLSMTVLLAFGAPVIAALFDQPDATNVVRGLSLAFLATTLGIIHDNRLKKLLDFRRRFIPEMCTAVTKFVVQIGLAVGGLGVWSLVWGQVAGAIVGSIMFWLVSEWRPRLQFDLAIARKLLRFGLPVTLLSVLAIVTTTADQIIIGHQLDATALGYYTIALRIPDMTVLSVCYIVSAALFPAYAKVQHDAEALRRGFQLTLRMVAIIVVPLAFGLVLVAHDVVPLFFGPQWAASIPVMQWLAIYALSRALSFNVGDVYKATGRPGVLNVLAVLRLSSIVVVLWAVAPAGIVAVAQGLAAVTIAMTLVEIMVASRLLKVGAFRLMFQFWPAMVAGLVMAGAAMAVQSLLVADASGVVRLVAVIPAAALAYGVTLHLIAPGTTTRLLQLLPRPTLRRRVGP